MENKRVMYNGLCKPVSIKSINIIYKQNLCGNLLDNSSNHNNLSNHDDNFFPMKGNQTDKTMIIVAGQANWHIMKYKDYLTDLSALPNYQ